MTIDDVLHRLGVDPAELTQAPGRQVHREAAARIGRNPCPCAGCGEPARVTGIVDVPGYGRRWLDRCRDCASWPPSTWSRPGCRARSTGSSPTCVRPLPKPGCS